MFSYVPQYCLSSPPLKIWPLLPCSPEINAPFSTVSPNPWKGLSDGIESEFGNSLRHSYWQFLFYSGHRKHAEMGCADPERVAGRLCLMMSAPSNDFQYSLFNICSSYTLVICNHDPHLRWRAGERGRTCWVFFTVAMSRQWRVNDVDLFSRQNSADYS